MRTATAFMMLAFARPAMVGAIWPSSRHLAQAMAQGADGAQRIVELGAGTGAITEALCECHPHTPTTVVELQPELAERLRERFPGMTVLQAPAHEVLESWPDGEEPVVVVSSLPFRSLPPRWRDGTSRAIERYLLAQPERRLIQYTYQPRAPFDLQLGDGLAWRKRTVVWRNAPPAWVWELGSLPDH
jgi:phosphatidylethanolamine/phosphatidyl-N-methylethanolamine N-methyltransferase